MYEDIRDIPPAVDRSMSPEDTSTEGGALRYELADLRIQIAAAHHQIDLIRPDVPRRHSNGLAYTPEARLQIMRGVR